MRIARIFDIKEIMKCLPMEREIANKGREIMKEKDLLYFIQSQLDNPLFGFFMAYDKEGNVKGYAVALLNLFPGMKRLLLLRIYAKEPGLMDLIIDTGREWAKQYGVKIIQMTVTKHIKAFQRRYKFKPVSVNMERRF